MKTFVSFTLLLFTIVLMSCGGGGGGGGGGEMPTEPSSQTGILVTMFPTVLADELPNDVITTVTITGSNFTKTQILSSGSSEINFGNLVYGSYHISAVSSSGGVSSGSSEKDIVISSPNSQIPITIGFNRSLVNVVPIIKDDYTMLNGDYHGISKFRACGFTLPRTSANTTTKIKVTGNTIEIDVTGTNEQDLKLVGTIPSSGVLDISGIWQKENGDSGNFTMIRAQSMDQTSIYMSFELTGSCPETLITMGTWAL